MTQNTKFTLGTIRHPSYFYQQTQYEVWRDVYEGGVYFRERYMRRLSVDESDEQFRNRKDISPIPAFAKTAVNEIRNSIFQRLVDVQRLGGSTGYQTAMKSDVDRKGNSMQKFLGIEVLTELLVIGRCGVYVDAPSEAPRTLGDPVPDSPYLYKYKAEDILSWTLEDRENLGQFKAVLLRDCQLDFSNHVTGIDLPVGEKKGYRLVYRDTIDDSIRVKLYDEAENIVITPMSQPDGSIVLDLDQVPFILLDIGDSLLKDAASYQIALLNAMSGALNFDLSSNVPFLTIQKDLRTSGSHLKDPTGSTNGSDRARSTSEKVGSRTGIYYDKDVDRPEFIAPPGETLTSSMKLQDQFRDDIRRLIHLSVEGKSGSRTESGEAKKISAQSLESGLFFIGSVLENGENQISRIWAQYEGETPAQVVYPETYSLKSDEEKLSIAEKKAEVISKVPSNKAKKAISKQIISLLLEDETSVEQLEVMMAEVDSASVVITDAEFIRESREAGLVSDKTASEALGFAPGEVEKAAKDHAARLERILKSQSSFQGGPSGGPGVQNPASRGVPDLDPDTGSARREQAQGRQENS
jgi:hypothetical protein